MPDSTRTVPSYVVACSSPRRAGLHYRSTVTFVVTTPAFSGPVELLLQLTSAHDVDILDVPALAGRGGFLSVLRERREEIDVEELSEFLLIASILVEMKSQRLLPGRDKSDPDEEFIGWEERDVLLARLLELRTYGAAADHFTSLFERAARSFPRLVGIDNGFVVQPPDLLAGVSAHQIAEAYLRGIEEKPVPVAEAASRHSGRGHRGRNSCFVGPAPPSLRRSLLQEADRRGQHPNRNHRQLLGAARAVQARPRHPSVKARPLVMCRWSGFRRSHIGDWERRCL
jgi:hypothetical protein